MTTYFIGTEIEDFNDNSNNMSHSTGGSRSDNTRVAIAMAGASEDARFLDGELSQIVTDELWISTSTLFGNSNSGGIIFLKLYGDDGSEILGFQIGGGTGIMTAQKFDGSWVTLAEGEVMSSGILYRLDFYIKLGASGIIRVYKDDVQVLAVDGLDLTWAGVTGVDKIRIQPHSSNSFRTTYHSEIIVADWNTRGSKVVLRAPDADGNYTDWNGGFADINEHSNDGTNISSDVADERYSFLTEDFPALGGVEQVAAVKFTGRGLYGDSGPQNVNQFFRISSTDYDESDIALGITHTNFNVLKETSPATATAWTPTELNVTEFGLRSRA